MPFDFVSVELSELIGTALAKSGATDEDPVRSFKITSRSTEIPTKKEKVPGRVRRNNICVIKWKAVVTLANMRIPEEERADKVSNKGMNVVV